MDRGLAEGRVQVCMLADRWSWAAGKSIMRQVVAVQGPVIEALPYCTESQLPLRSASGRCW